MRSIRSHRSNRRKRTLVERLEQRDMLAADVVISELLAKNETGLRDDDGDRSDWIEISNRGDASIDLEGWSLTDDARTPQKWQFPSLTLEPGAVQVVFASDKDRRETETLHTNFKLNRDGEYLALVDPSGSVASAYNQFPPQAADVSYGLAPSDAEVEGPRFFDVPTPGEPNVGQGFAGLLDGVELDLKHGFYSSAQSVTLRAKTPGASLAYRFDGADPANVTAEAELAHPASSSELATIEIPITATTVIRAAEVMSDFIPSSAETQSYFFVSDIVRQSTDGSAPDGWPSRSVNGQQFVYGMDPDVVDDPDYADLIEPALLDLPSISIVMDGHDIFDRQDGFFVNGERSRDNPREWERPTSVELVYPDGREGFQIDAGIRMRGGFSRRPDNPKHAFRLFFRDEYGDGALEYPLFDDEGSRIFENMDLRTAQVPSWSLCWPVPIPTDGGCQYNTMLRDVFARDLQGATGQPYTRSRFYHLYLNGQYWGLFQSQERPEASYGATYFGGDEDDYDVVKVESFPHRTVATDGTLDAWRQLWEASVNGFETQEDYLRVQGRDPQGNRDPELPVLLDVDNLIDYMLVTLYTGNLDGPISNFLDNVQTNNWFGVYNRNADQGFQFFVHDSEWVLFSEDVDRTGPWGGGETFDQSNPQWLHQQLMQNVEYRTRFADRAQGYLFNGGLMTPEGAISSLNQRAAEIDLAIIAESARWGDTKRRTPYTKADWLVEVDRIREEIIPGRTEALIEQLRAARLSDGRLAPLLPDFDAPKISPSSSPNAVVPIAPGGTIEIDSSETVYFTTDGTDPRANASVVDFETVIDTGATVHYWIPADDSVHNTWFATSFNDDAWPTGTTGIGFDVRGNNFPELIATSIEAEMRSVNGSVYTRIPFEISDADSIDIMQLRLMYDDGFVAYLNGELIGHDASDIPPAWNSNATKTRNAAQSNSFSEFDLTGFRHLLHSGRNVLAIQGLNRSASNTDFLLLPNLLVGSIQEVGLASTALLYDGPITIDEAMTVRARAWINGTWGTLVEQSYTTDVTIGDVNGDGFFDSADLVHVFQAGEYEDLIVGNSTWFEGDWNGDGDFNSRDLVLAFQRL